MKKRGSYLPAIIVTIILMLPPLAPLIPIAVKKYVPFPKLEEATYLEGTFDYEGEFPYVKLPKFFVVNVEGRHEFKCGYLMGRHGCFTFPKYIKGRSIKVWTTFTHGKIQHIVEGSDDKQLYDRLQETYAQARSASFDSDYYSGRKFSFIPFLIMLPFLGYLIHRERQRRRDIRRDVSNSK
jgi:hypothetical protein